MTPELPSAIPATPVPPPKRRRGFFRRWLRRLLFFVLGVLLLAAGYWFIDRWLERRAGKAKLQPLLAELDAADPEWCGPAMYEQRNARLAPPAANTADQALDAAKLIVEPSLKSEFVLQASVWRNLPLGQLPQRDVAKEMRELTGESRAALDAALRLRPLPNSGFRVDLPDHRSLMGWPPHASRLVKLSARLDAHAFVQATDNRPADALRASVAVAVLSGAIGDEPCAVAQYPRMALAIRSVQMCERTLALTVPSANELAALVPALRAEPPAGWLRFVLRSNRDILSRTAGDVDAGRVPRDDIDVIVQVGLGDRRDLSDRVVIAYLARYIPGEHASLLLLSRRALDAAEIPLGPDRWKAAEQIDADYSTFRWTWGNTPVKSLFHPFGRVMQADFRTTALLRSAVAAIACERYRLKNGRFPKALDELPKELLAAVPDDPYTGKPLSYKATDTGVVVYSVGSDLKDDGGKRPERELDERHSDIGFTLLDPKHRRRPPAPKPVDE